VLRLVTLFSVHVDLFVRVAAKTRGGAVGVKLGDEVENMKDRQ